MKTILKVPSIFNASYSEPKSDEERNTILERNAFLALVNQAQLCAKDSSSETKFKISLADAKRLLQLDHNTTNKELCDVFYKLTSISYLLNILGKDKSSPPSKIPIDADGVSWICGPLVSSARHIQGTDFIEFRINEYLYDYFVHPEKHMYTNTDLYIISGVKYDRTDLLYRHLLDYFKVSQPIMSIEDLRRILHVTPFQYVSFSNFKHRLLDRLIKDINARTNINVECETLYITTPGFYKKAYGFRFTVTSKDNCNPVKSARDVLQENQTIEPKPKPKPVNEDEIPREITTQINRLVDAEYADAPDYVTSRERARLEKFYLDHHCLPTA